MRHMYQTGSKAICSCATVGMQMVMTVNVEEVLDAIYALYLTNSHNTTKMIQMEEVVAVE